MSETYERVCVLERGHAGEHLPYGLAPDKDEFGNKEVGWPRCHHVSPLSEMPERAERYRIVFEIIDPRYPDVGWHEVVKEHGTLSGARSQKTGLLELEAEGEDVRFRRIERSAISGSRRWRRMSDVVGEIIRRERLGTIELGRRAIVFMPRWMYALALVGWFAVGFALGRFG